MLSRLLVKPGMMCPMQALIVGMDGIAKTAAPEEVLYSPVAVWIVVFGAFGLIWSRGASGVK
jgi:hypothetical protein